MTVVTEVPELDKLLGMLVYARPDLYLGKCVEFSMSPETFGVYEVGLNGSIASESLCSDDVPSEGFTIYVLCKEGLSTFEAVEYLRKSLGAPLGFAGLKDASARTCQFVTVPADVARRVGPKYYVEISESAKIMMCSTGASSGKTLRRGDLLGNRFTVKLHMKCGSGREHAVKVINGLGGEYLPNFFGYQRFGTRRPVTHLVGEALLEGDFCRAVEVLVGYSSPSELSLVSKARKAFLDGKLEESLELFPKSFWIERRVVSSLMRGDSPKDALQRLGRRYLSLFVEAYQSYLFNLALSELLITYEDLLRVIEKCEVLRLPSPNVGGSDVCSEVVARVFRENVGSPHQWSRKYLREGVRQTYFVPNDAVIEGLGSNYVVFSFTLQPSAYATVLLRELLRENLRV